jgi:hypothetical protein
MKKSLMIPDGFNELSIESSSELYGGGFAYDVGRFLRFGGLATSPITAPMAILDAITNKVVNDYQNG